MRRLLDYVLVGAGGLLVFGCSIATMGATRGETEREYRGSVPLVFTNATPDRMCGLYMSFDDEDDYGDNWLPASGVASGKSVEFKVRQGKYKARWDTCRSGDKAKPYFAATMFREMSFKVAEPTQLFAYVASAMAPTKLAPPRWDMKMVRAQGQPIDQDPAVYTKRYAGTTPVRKTREASAPAVTRYLCRFCVHGIPSGIETGFSEPLVEVNRFDMSAFVEKKALVGKPGDKRDKIKPSLRRNHDVAQARANYRMK